MTNPLEKLKENNPLSGLKELHPTINAIIIVCAIIMLWRGIWGLLDEYLFPNSPTFSYLISITFGGLVLYLDGFSLKDLRR